MFFASTPMRLALVALAVTPAVLFTGCANMVNTASPVVNLAANGTMSGTIHGGRQPVIQATVKLMAAGNAGYGSAATMLQTTSTDANGSFAFSGYTCPAATSATASQFVYITASGGMPTTGITNNAAAFLLALGDCATVQAANPTLNINEVTTVASMSAMQQFFAPDATNGLGSFGTSATNLNGLKNAIAVIPNLVTLATGNANASINVSGAVTGYTTNPVVTITPEYMKINTMADVLAACVNSTGSTNAATGAFVNSATCSTLFSDVSSNTVLDTLQAAYYLATNPTSTTSGTSNIAAIYNLSTPQSPFAPSLASAPNDWTIGVTYGSSSSQSVNNTATPPVASTNYLLTEPEYVAVDAKGNVWVANFGSTTVSQANSVTELSPTGVPLNNVLNTTQIVGPRNLIIDPSGDVYVASYGASANGYGKMLAEYTGAGASNMFTIGAGPEALASDGAGNVFIATGSSSTAFAMDLEYLPAGSKSGTTSTVLASGMPYTAGTFSTLAIDSNDTLWLSNNASTATLQYLCTFTGTPACTGTSTTAGGQTGSQSIAIDHGNNIWVGNYSASAGSASVIAATKTTTITGVAGSPYMGGGQLNATRSIFDGGGNYWVTNYLKNAGTVSELTGAGLPVSPSTGFTHTFNSAEGIAIDPSGNVWVGNAAAAATATVNGYLTEILGQAVPVITPAAANLPLTAGGANTIGTRP